MLKQLKIIKKIITVRMFRLFLVVSSSGWFRNFIIYNLLVTFQKIRVLAFMATVIYWDVKCKMWNEL